MLSLGLDGLTDDAILAVNEAVANSVRHAYPTDAGNVELELTEQDDRVTITIRDHGRGPHGHNDTAGRGFGIEIMHAVTDSTTITAPPDGGTEVQLTFHRAQ